MSSPRRLSEHEVRRLRLRGQRLAPRLARRAGVAGVAAATLGLQAQSPPAAALSVRSRSRGLTAADVERARLEERSVVRTWCMRGTVHLLATEDVPWLLALVAAPQVRAARRRLGQVGLAGDRADRALRAVDEALAEHGELARDELLAAVRRRVRGVDDSAPVTYWVPHLAALEGIACATREPGGRTHYARLSDWAGISLRAPDDMGAAELARRYLLAFGPARPQDLAAWSGLPVGDARAAWSLIAGELSEVRAAGTAMWRLRRRPGGGDGGSVVSLLAAFDTYLLGYRGRDLMLARERAGDLMPGGGMISPTVAVDGWLVATWKLDARRRPAVLTVTPYGRLDRAVRAGLEAEAADVGRFLDVPVVLELR